MDMNSTDANAIFLAYEEDTFLSKDQYAGLKESLNTMSLVVYSLNFVFGVIGNGVVIWVTGFKMKKTVNTVWFLNLAVADFLFTAFLPLSVTYLALNFHWPFGNFMCKLNSASSYLNMYASVYFLVAISLDRCVSVVWPVWAQNHRSVRKASQVSLIVWIMALILSIPYFVFRDTDDPFNDGRIICFNNYLISGKHNPLSSFRLIKLRYWATSITRFLLGFVVPFTVIVSCYAVLIKHVRRNRTLASKSGRMFKIIIAVIVAFFVCWVPLHIMLLIEMVYRTTTTDHNLEHFITIGIPLTTSLAFTNSCLNPLLYVFIGQDFKNTVRKSLLKIMETAFQEDSGTDQKTVSTSDNQDRSTQSTGV